MKEQVNHPEHYGGEGNPYEATKVIEAWNLDFCLGNAVKYISRLGKKDSTKTIEDLKKSEWYIRREINRLELIELREELELLKPKGTPTSMPPR